jgi:hypothetical protein
MRSFLCACLCASAVFAHQIRPGVAFEPNLGQADPSVQFVARHGRHTLLLNRNGAISVLDGKDIVRMRLLGSNGASAVTGAEPKPGRSNYLDVNESTKNVVDVPHFGRVVLHDVYPSIDLAFYATGDLLEYDFLLKPGADPGQIRLQFQGANPTIAANGDLVLKTASGELRQHKPHVYQQAQVIPSRYKLNRDSVTFELGAYNKDKELVIDPPVTYMTFMGGTGRDTLAAVKTDGSGNAYLFGIGTTGMPQLNPFGSLVSGSSASVTKFGPSGQLVYSTFLTISGTPRAAAVTASGEAMMSFDSQARIVRINSAGSGFVYNSTTHGATGIAPNSGAADSAGNYYACGGLLSTANVPAWATDISSSSAPRARSFSRLTCPGRVRKPQWIRRTGCTSTLARRRRFPSGR